MAAVAAGGVVKPAKPSKGLPTGLGAPIPQGSLGGSGGSGATVSPNGPSPLGVAAASGVSDTGSGFSANGGPSVANSVYNSGYTGAYGSFPPDGSYAGGGVPAASPAGGVRPGDYGSAFPPSGSMPSNRGNPWKDPINQAFLQARDAASTPGVGITDPVALEAARQARQQAIMAYKQAQRPPPGFQGDPNSLIPRGTTSGGVTQYYNPATGGMYVGNPFRTFGQGMTGLLGAAPGPARGW